MSCQQVPTTPAFNLYPRSVQVGEFEVAIDGGIWVAIRALPMPEQVFGASDIPGPYLHEGEEELLPSDVLFEGECNHHRRMDRGWTYWVTVCQKDGEVLCLKSGFSEEKSGLSSKECRLNT
jgi:hypothetical protein